MALCVDVVLNHTAREHAWARAAMAGDADKLAFYRTFPDRTVPDAYERTLPDVFPAIAPGSFTWEPELERWVWTTFNPYQWDLDYTNPAVFRAMAEAMLGLANAGVDVLRLDAVPFLWKREGTDSPEPARGPPAAAGVPRAACGSPRPRVAFKAEAIVSPRDLVAYLGAGRHEGKECDLAYHNVLMVLLWSSLASGRVALMTRTLAGMPPVPPGAGWVTYVRCHDDIGWAVTEEDAAAVGEDGHLHRRFLADFYAGEFPGTFARGARFQPEPQTGEARTSGTTASLAGLEAALERGDALARGAGGPAHPAAARGRVRPRRPAADLHGRRAGAAQRPRASATTRRTRRQPLAAPARRWTGRPRSAAPTRRPSRAACGPACARSRPRAAPTRAAHAQGRSDAGVDRQRPRLRPRARARRRPAAACSPTSAPRRSGSTRAWRASTACDAGAGGRRS